MNTQLQNKMYGLAFAYAGASLWERKSLRDEVIGMINSNDTLTTHEKLDTMEYYCKIRREVCGT